MMSSWLFLCMLSSILRNFSWIFHRGKMTASWMSSVKTLHPLCVCNLVCHWECELRLCVVAHTRSVTDSASSKIFSYFWWHQFQEESLMWSKFTQIFLMLHTRPHFTHQGSQKSDWYHTSPILYLTRILNEDSWYSIFVTCLVLCVWVHYCCGRLLPYHDDFSCVSNSRKEHRTSFTTHNNNKPLIKKFEVWGII